MNLDFADLFKPIIVDRVIFTLINRSQLSDEDFVKNQDGFVYLSDDGKRVFIDEFERKLAAKLEHNGRSVSYHKLMEEEIWQYYKYISAGEKYTPYKYY